MRQKISVYFYKKNYFTCHTCLKTFLNFVPLKISCFFMTEIWMPNSHFEVFVKSTSMKCKLWKNLLFQVGIFWWLGIAWSTSTKSLHIFNSLFPVMWSSIDTITRWQKIMIFLGIWRRVQKMHLALYLCFLTYLNPHKRRNDLKKILP